jgi:CRP-like cAMP-binding protein
VPPRPIRDTRPSRWLVRQHQSALFSNISQQECKEIVSAARDRVLARAQTIHVEGDRAQRVVLLTSGSAKIVQFGQNGTEVILRLCGPGELVGTLGFSTDGRHSATARALQPSGALVWEIGVFDSLLRRFPVLRLNTALILAKQLRDIEDRFREMVTCRVGARLSHQIVRLMEQVGQPNDGAVEISISREELAQLIGTTVFTVSRLLSEWDERGIVSARRECVLVRNLKALEDLSQ